MTRLPRDWYENLPADERREVVHKLTIALLAQPENLGQLKIGVGCLRGVLSERQRGYL